MADVKRAFDIRHDPMAVFRPQTATPELIERLPASPAFAGEELNLREYALVLAGPGRWLDFGKPSDLLEAYERFFPAELARKRADPLGPLPSLYGPSPVWSAESIAWVGLWRCLPLQAWLEPGRNPFRRERGLDPWPMIVGSDEVAGEFGNCLRDASGRTPFLQGEARVAWTQQMRDMAARATPVLVDRFDTHLQTTGCRGTGPDDCVLVLLMWAQLTPAEPRLARALQRLEAEVAPGAPLPPLQRPKASYEGNQPVGEVRHVALTRRAAFVRAKVTSVLAAPSAWPAGAMQAMLVQLMELEQQYRDAVDWRWGAYRLDTARQWNPWIVLRREATPEVIDAALQLLDREERRDCFKHDIWFGDGRWGAELHNRLAELALQRGGAACRKLDWASLRRGTSDTARLLRQRLLDRLDNDPGMLRENALTGFTNNGADCFATPVPADVQSLCRRWIHEPQHTPLKLARAKLTLAPSEAFRERHVRAPGGYGQTSTDWQSELWQGLSPAFSQPLRERLQAMNARDEKVFEARVWSKAGHRRVLVMLERADSHSTQLWFVLSPEGLAELQVPARLLESKAWGYGVVQVSDLDGDGQLELWFAAGFHSCTGDDSDMDRDMDCQAREADMGEVQGNTVSYFTRDAAQASARGPGVLPEPQAVARETRGDCNLVRVAAALEDAFPIQTGREPSDDMTRLRQLVCKPHPDHPSQTLAAFLYETGEGEKGFGLALIDTARNHLLRLFHETVEEDATTRIDTCCITLDTARYHLRPGVRAVGLRLDIDHGPRYAEGGSSNRLVLLVPDGRDDWRVVLDGVSMSSWQLTNSTSDCSAQDDPVCERDVDTRTLSLAPGSTTGWRDLLLTTRTVNDGRAGGKRVTNRLLRMGKAGRYE